METAMKLRRLILNDGRSIRSVSKETGLSRNTIRKYVRGDGLPNYQRKEPAVLHKLKHYEAQLLQWYETDLTRPKRERRTATKLYEQLVQQGYSGSYYPVCRYLRKVRSTQPGVNQAFIPFAGKFHCNQGAPFWLDVAHYYHRNNSSGVIKAHSKSLRHYALIHEWWK